MSKGFKGPTQDDDAGSDVAASTGRQWPQRPPTRESSNTSKSGSGEPDDVGSPKPAGVERRKVILVIVVVLLVAASWIGSWLIIRTANENDRREGSAFFGAQWEVTSVTGSDVDWTVGGKKVLSTSAPSGLLFNGCNGGNGSVHLEDGFLVVDRLAMSETGCAGADSPALQAWDGFIMGFLPSGPSVTVEGQRLVLANGAVTIEFVSAGSPGSASNGQATGPSVPTEATSPLVVPGEVPSTPTGEAAAWPWADRWAIDGIESASDGALEVATVVGGRPPEIDLSGERSVAFTGCNGGQGTASAEGDRLVVQAMTSTELACGGADGARLMDQDALLAEILESDPKLTIKGDTLTLSGAKGTVEAIRVA